jgi:hypothetical protein
VYDKQTYVPVYLTTVADTAYRSLMRFILRLKLGPHRIVGRRHVFEWCMCMCILMIMSLVVGI